ncbi:hypothetical protein FQA39_LY10174 [Lamprigera yunnana]|nr:hypothetical protein FQA39_LY10174 [Lamprigera yunnana]
MAILGGYPYTNKETIKCYKEVPEVLEKLHQKGYILAVASRTSEIRGANQLIDLFGWDKYFTYKEIYPGRKTTHFSKFKEQSGLSYGEMLFFDDEIRNIHDLRGEGVVSVLVRDGVSKKVVEEGLKDYNRERSYK